MTRWLIGLSLCGWALTASTVATAEQRHFTIKDPSAARYQDYEFSLEDSLEIVEAQVSKAVALLSFETHTGPLPKVGEPYRRLEHFGTWTLAEGCKNVRHKVLERDSLVPVDWSRCHVNKGEWFDVYSGRTFTNPRDIEIDHIVALKNAYVSGAWKWDQKTRCTYTNYRGNDVHLKAVSAYENTKKSDLTPADYMPSNGEYTCEYLKNWLYIKAVWNLMLSESEVEAIQDLVKDNGCSAKEFKVELDEIAEQREIIRNSSGVCGK